MQTLQSVSLFLTLMSALFLFAKFDTYGFSLTGKVARANTFTARALGAETRKDEICVFEDVDASTDIRSKFTCGLKYKQDEDYRRWALKGEAAIYLDVVLRSIMLAEKMSCKSSEPQFMVQWAGAKYGLDSHDFSLWIWSTNWGLACFVDSDGKASRVTVDSDGKATTAGCDLPTFELVGSCDV